MTESETEALVRDSLRDSAATAERAAAELPSAVAAAAALVAETLRRGGKVLACGNGGSAADAQHMAAELVGRFVRERDPLPAIALTTDSSIVTALANDYGVEAVFERQLRGLGAAGDVLIALSTSGNSQNVIAAVRAARERGIRTIALTGADGGALAGECEIALRAPASATARVQEVHIALIHAICAAVDGVERG
jgi:D-sedoheptulose 7-phosphate isomerase